MTLSDITKLFVASGMTQSQIAKETGLSQPTISDILRGNICNHNPSKKVLTGYAKLAKKKGFFKPMEKVIIRFCKI